MDNLSLEVLVNELRGRVLNTSIQSVKLITKRTFIIALRLHVTEYLVLCLQPSFPNLCLLPEDVPCEASRSDVLLALRKYLVGGRITALRKSLADRVVFMDVETSRLSEQPERFSLAIELIPNRVRACLLDAQQQVLVWLSSASRTVGAYSPPAMPACRVDSIEEGEFCKLLEGADSSGSSIFGLSSRFAREVLYQSHHDPSKAWQAMQTLLKNVNNGPHTPRIYHVEERTPASSAADRSPTPPAKLVIAPFELQSLAATPFESFSSMNALCAEVFYRSLQRLGRLESGSGKLGGEIKKKQRLEQKLQAQLAKVMEAQSFKLYANLLYAQHDKSSKGTSLRVPNLFDPDLGEVDIPLSAELSIVENANRYHRLFRKAGRSVSQLTARLRSLESEIAALQRQEERLPKANSEVGSDTQTSELLNDSQPDKKTALAVSERRSSGDSRSDLETLIRRTAKVFRSSEGMQILVGKSSKDNDVLTSKVAQSEDFWLHVADYGGSHVVLRNPEKLKAAPKQSLLEAAELAAYFSQARNAPKVEVHYTQKKFVSKPKGAKPGLVRLKEYKSISVRPRLLSEISTGKTAAE